VREHVCTAKSRAHELPGKRRLSVWLTPSGVQGEYTCTKGDASMEAFCMSFDFLVAAGYLLLVVFSLRVLLAKLAQEQERKWQIFFHSFLMVGCICTSDGRRKT